MAVQDTETGDVTWDLVPLAGPSRHRSHHAVDYLEKAVQAPSTLYSAAAASSLTAIRSVQHGFGNASSASVRFYKCAWPKVSSKLPWPSVRLYHRTLSEASSTTTEQEYSEKPATSVLSSPPKNQLGAGSLALRFLQMALALYVFLSVSESFRSKITYDGRVRQIQPLMLTTLVYSSLAFVCYFLLNLDKILKASNWRLIAVVSVPLDMAMICVFLAKDAIFGVHSFECAAARGVVNTIDKHQHLQNISSLELQRHYAGSGRGTIYIHAARDVCLIPSSVYVVCLVAALSYLGSAVVTVHQVLGGRRSLSSVVDNQCQYRGHVEHAIPASLSRPFRTSQPGLSLYDDAPSPRPEWSSSSEGSSDAPPRPRPIRSPDDEDPKYANLPIDLVERLALARPQSPPPRSYTVPPRTSCETTFSMDPDHYAISDGFRPRSRPPSFSSSRESSQGPPEYRSRPPSLHAVILVAP